MQFVHVLKDKIREDMNNFTDDMANGQCTDFASYKELCGVVRGLAFAERHLLDLAKKIEESNDE
jgi:hypothetical protein